MEPFACPDNTISKLEEEFLDLEEEALERPDQTSDLLKAASDIRRENVEPETNNPARCSIPDLPVELWTMILGFLPDKNHVRAAVHSCRYLLSLWNTNRVQLITNMLGMAPGVLEEAACAANFPLAPLYDSTGVDIEQLLQSRSLGYRVGRVNGSRRHTPFPMDLCIPIKMALSFTGSRNRCLASSCAFRDVSRLENIHPTVRKLADIYIEQCAASNPKLAGTLRERPVTLGERERIERAFYRFEIFRRTFGSFEGRWARETNRGIYDIDADWYRDWLDDPVPHFIQEFKECFNTVELIQMHCIYGFLKRLVTPAINDMLWHDCELDELSLIENWATDQRVSAHVLAGIHHVYNIWAAFNDRSVTRLCGLIQAVRLIEHGSCSIPKQHDTIFYHVLTAELYTGRNSSLEVTKSKIAIHDSDESPRDACLAVASSIQRMGKKSPDDLRHEIDGLAPDRQWGFVMWDQRRLDMLGFFEQNHASPRPRSPLTATSTMLLQHRNSLQQRIYSQGLGPERIWWEGALGPVYTLGPRQYNTWYPLAAPGS
ncbi:hypothetical protein INS49_001340 [Diaporthe citri]|uniref:uncharacterized protein n=1 Tax=Diaporthe citri TaxID=83186 RepID=UPI001C801AF4|nr:uncharacterized protein INS49_001340 [Diaporthe citri]KAG6367156.1 hypothetical protein INS49_001340 [Diaporthe citri]